MEVIIFTGLQASGKSSFYKSKFFNSHIRVSLDLLKTRSREKKLVQYCLDTEAKAVIDNTNPTRMDRARYISSFKDNGYRVIGYYFSSSIKDCLERNSERDECIPEKGVLATYNKLEIPSLDEGYDELYFVKLADNQFKVMEWEDEI